MPGRFAFTVWLNHRQMDVDKRIRTANYKKTIIFVRWLLAEEMPEQPGAVVWELGD